MSLLKNKALIIVLVVIALAAIAVVGYKAFSLYSFNSFAKELNSENKNLFTSFKTEVATTNKIEENIVKAMDVTASFDKATNTQYLDTAKADYEQSLKDYKKGVDELESKSKDVAAFKDMPLWLATDQKKFATDTATALKQYLEGRKADYQYQIKTGPINGNMFQIVEDYIVLVDYFVVLETNLTSAKTLEQVAQAYSKDLSLLKPLEKYTKADYEFEGQATLASEFPNSYTAFGEFQKAFAAFYMMFKGLAAGDSSQLDQATALLNQTGDLSSTVSGLSAEVAQKNKPAVVKIKDSYIDYTKALDFFSDKKLHNNLLSKEKTLTQNNQNKLIVFSYLVRLYHTDEQKYPSDTSFSSLVTTLKSGNNFDGSLKYNESDFTYASDGTYYFEIGHNDEVSGKQSPILFGVKEGTSTSLGVTVSTPVIKVENKKVRLEFVSVLDSSVKSLPLPR